MESMADIEANKDHYLDNDYMDFKDIFLESPLPTSRVVVGHCFLELSVPIKRM